LLAQKQVQNQFDRAAASYDRAAELQRRMGNSLLKQISNLESSSSSLIDLGCGTGELLGQLEIAGFENLTGLDLSSQMIEFAKTRTSKTRFINASIEDIPCEDNQFATVVSNAAIQWCDLQTAAKEICRILVPNGTLFLTTFVEGTLAQWHQAFLSNGFESRVHPLVSQTEAEAAFANAGFTIHDIQTSVDTTSFASIESMFASVKDLGATNAMQSRSQMSRHEYRTLKRHFESLLESDGKLELDFVWTNVIATKMAQR
jgi:malonyl-CoA O-methyltransferase